MQPTTLFRIPFANRLFTKKFDTEIGILQDQLINAGGGVIKTEKQTRTYSVYLVVKNIFWSFQEKSIQKIVDLALSPKSNLSAEEEKDYLNFLENEGWQSN